MSGQDNELGRAIELMERIRNRFEDLQRGRLDEREVSEVVADARSVTAIADLLPIIVRANAYDTAGIALSLAAHAVDDLRLLREAVAAGVRAVEAANPADPFRAGYVHDLSANLLVVSEVDRDRAGIEHAVALAREAVAATPVTHPSHALRQSNLAAAVRALAAW